jgi:hypothetical protein
MVIRHRQRARGILTSRRVVTVVLAQGAATELTCLEGPPPGCRFAAARPWVACTAAANRPTPVVEGRLLRRG